MEKQHNFHSCTTVGNTNTYDGVIQCSGGTSGTNGKGLMEYFGATHKFLLGGICFDKGNLTNGTFMQTYTTGYTGGVIAANSPMVPIWSVLFTSFTGCIAFGTAPNISLTVITNNPNSIGIVLSIALVTTTGFSMYAYNSRNTNALANTWGVSFTATGGY